VTALYSERVFSLLIFLSLGRPLNIISKPLFGSLFISSFLPKSNISDTNGSTTTNIMESPILDYKHCQTMHGKAFGSPTKKLGKGDGGKFEVNFIHRTIQYEAFNSP
jgi:hypothetical protein